MLLSPWGADERSYASEACRVTARAIYQQGAKGTIPMPDCFAASRFPNPSKAVQHHILCIAALQDPPGTALVSHFFSRWASAMSSARPPIAASSRRRWCSCQSHVWDVDSQPVWVIQIWSIVLSRAVGDPTKSSGKTKRTGDSAQNRCLATTRPVLAVATALTFADKTSRELTQTASRR